MKYFRNTELAKLYKVSEKSVRNWIDAAQAGKIDLQLFEHSGKYFIANTSKNASVIEELVEKGKKYKNTRGIKKLKPKTEFYQHYNTKQITDIISNITIHRETPLQYTYVDGGAIDWDKYATRLLREQTPNLLNGTIDMLETAADYIDQLTGNKKINVIDLGPGNGLPIRPTLERLLKQNRLNRYIPIDISQDMLNILEQNVKKWFGGSIAVEPHTLDISFERFSDFSSSLIDTETVNIVFLLGGTLGNFRSPAQVLQTINNSIGPDDLLITSGYLDTPKNRRYFDYYTSNDKKVPVQDGLILDLLNIDESLYEVEQIFNQEKRARSISIRPKLDLSVTFELPTGTKEIELRKGEPILIWRHWHKNIVDAINQLNQNDFDLMQATKSPDGEFLLTIAKIKIGIDK